MNQIKRFFRSHKKYFVTGSVFGFIAAMATWLVSMSEWGFMMGITAGWIPALVVFIFVLFMWPLLLLLALLAGGWLWRQTAESSIAQKLHSENMSAYYKQNGEWHEQCSENIRKAFPDLYLGDDYYDLAKIAGWDYVQKNCPDLAVPEYPKPTKEQVDDEMYSLAWEKAKGLFRE